MKNILVLLVALAVVIRDAKCAAIFDVVSGSVGNAAVNNAQLIKVNYPANFQQDLIAAGTNLLSGSKMITMPLGSTDVPGGTGAYIGYTLFVPIQNPIPQNTVGSLIPSLFGRRK
jgi:hypothetical protein